MHKLLRVLLTFRNPLRVLLDRLSLIKSPLVSHTLRNGLTFWCRPGSSDLMSVWDIFTSQKHSDYLSQFSIHPGDNVVDIGANIGVFSIQAAHAGATVTAYEPMADTVNVLRANISANGFAPCISAHRKGVAPETGVREIYLGNRNHSMSCSFYPHENVGADSVRIETVPFTEVLAAHRHIDLLKIDCEGAEFEFLPGSDLSNVDRIVLEYHEIALGWSHKTLEARLRAQGFQTQVKPWKPCFGILYAWRA